jgi:hypothetical protein
MPTFRSPARSVHGYHECLVRQGDLVGAAAVQEELDDALAQADVLIAASCACRTVAAAD